MTKVIIFNAPPDTGKDYLVDHLVSSGVGTYYKAEFKKRLKTIVLAVYGLSEEEHTFFYLRENKDKKFERLGGKSIRECYIEVSEDVIKPFYGKDYFGKAAVDSLVEGGVNLFSDGGFPQELVPLVEAVGGANVLVVRLKGVGSFVGDSRDYLSSALFPTVNFSDIVYSKDEVGLQKVIQCIDLFLDQITEGVE